MFDTALENGMTVPNMALSMARVFFLATRGLTSETATEEAVRDVLPNPGWLNAAAVMAAMYAATDEEEQTLTYRQLAETVHTAVHRGLTGDSPPVQYDHLPARERLAYEVVGRHAAALTQLDEDDLSNLGSTEVFWADKVSEYARTRGVHLEQPEAA